MTTAAIAIMESNWCLAPPSAARTVGPRVDPKPQLSRPIHKTAPNFQRLKCICCYYSYYQLFYYYDDYDDYGSYCYINYIYTYIYIIQL